ncbi:hypothetical protein HPB49_015419 [Dermacentor silvarum]|uniref:Uncharacterized protein n=1 Tax=Dermacentor silvarum TaxID=543639 RepID=A0ACB8E1I4_DERSI|nr:hypothetical protein HPB49_015419 [Dermacentor silvarum]
MPAPVSPPASLKSGWSEKRHSPLTSSTALGARDCTTLVSANIFMDDSIDTLAYGQTRSGKTYTIVTAYDPHVNPHEQVIIPRPMKHLFDGITACQQEARDQGNPPPDFKVNVQFMEL